MAWLDNNTELLAVMPEQMFSSARLQSPELRLMLACLTDVVEYLLKYDPTTLWPPSRRRDWIHDYEWLMCDNSEYLHSFVNVCGHLSFSATAIRRNVCVKLQAKVDAVQTVITQ